MKCNFKFFGALLSVLEVANIFSYTAALRRGIRCFMTSSWEQRMARRVVVFHFDRKDKLT